MGEISVKKIYDKSKGAGGFMKRQRWQEWAQNEDNIAVLTAWARAGLTDEQIAKSIGISRSTLSDWKKKHESIRIALSTGKEFADRMVENSLYKMTQGYTVKIKKAFKVKKVEYDNTGKKKSEKEELAYAEETEYVNPDIRAIMFWLKNRKPEIWREKIIEKDDGDSVGTGVVVLTPTQVQNLQEAVEKNEAEQ